MKISKVPLRFFLPLLWALLMAVILAYHFVLGTSVYFNSPKDVVWAIFLPGAVIAWPLIAIIDSLWGIHHRLLIDFIGLGLIFLMNLLVVFCLGLFIEKMKLPKH